MKNSKKIKVRDQQTISDPHGNYRVVYVDVMQGSARVRRFVKPMSKDGIKVSDLVRKAEEFINNNPEDLTPTII